MVDAEDLKSFGYCNRVGSSPTIPTTKFSSKLASVENLSVSVAAPLCGDGRRKVLTHLMDV